jgi:BirA family biotin operon repressor/biotin-[acetyl-CoA-carboxylase] ligase
MPDDAQADGFRRIALHCTGSTNDEALVRARAGEPGPLWITAHVQTAGRGRRGRSWASEPGNLYATLLLTNPCQAAQAPELSFVAALAVHDALVAAASGCAPALRLKWPNDVLLDGRKLAGILVEGEGGCGRFAVATGIGVNCTCHPADAAYPATDLAREGFAVEPEQLFPLLARAFAGRLAQWDGGRAFAAVRADWLRRACARGEQVSVRLPLPDRTVIGTFQDIDEHGRLLLQTASGTRDVITAGDVFAPGPEPAHEGRP